MTATTIIKSARSEGVVLSISPSGTVKVTGKTAAVNQWLEPIKQHKADILAALKAEAANDETQNRIVVPDPAEALNRPLAYLLEPDDRLEGLCLMIDADLQDIRTGRLPLESARLYLQNHERDHPHLAERLKRARMAITTRADTRQDDRHPLDLKQAILRMKLDGLEIVKDDGDFIRERIGTRKDWPDLVRAYAEHWLLAAATEPAPHRRQNAGRRAANSWLLEVTR